MVNRKNNNRLRKEKQIKMDLHSLDVSCEPMDIDLSSNSLKNMDNSFSKSTERENISKLPSPESITISTSVIKREPIMEISSSHPVSENKVKEFQIVKKYHIIMQPKTSERPSVLSKLSILIALLACVLVFYLNTFSCCEELDINNMKDALSRKLYGQERAVDLLLKSLQVQANSKILFLYGGTGVGKTYTTTILFEKVWNLTNVYHYVMPSFTEIFPNDLLLGMSFCKTSILIVDDLSRNDFHIKEHISNVIERSNYLNKNITVVLIFNYNNIEKNFMKHCNPAFFEFELKEAFNDIKAHKEYIKFEPLTEEHLKLCIKHELGYSVVADMDQIVKNFNVTQDGCKGVYTKMKLLNIL